MNKKILLAVAYDEDANTYSVDVASGSSVPECAFCMAVVIKCLIRDNVIKSVNDVTDLINKYCTDSQYDELKNDEVKS